MKEVVAKKYVKALIGELSAAELQSFIANLSKIAAAFSVDKFKNIISLPTLKTTQKVEFVLSLVNEPNLHFKNFIKLLGVNKRLELIPVILQEILAQQAARESLYRGNVYGNFELTSEQIGALEENFSKRFNAKIKLESSKNEYNGIKVDLDDLGVEINFSVDRLKAQLSEHILKAI